MEDRDAKTKMDAKSQENNHGLVCQGFDNVFGTCYLSVALQCILAMETTRRAFMELPVPGSPEYSIPDESMTGLIYSLFLERQQTHKISLQQGEQGPYDGNVAAVIVEWMHNRFPDTILPLGNGGDAASTLYNILQILICEGYVTGLKEDLCGTYRSRVTCKTCSAAYDLVEDDIMVTFWVDKGKEFDLLRCLTESKFKDKDMADSSTRFLTVRHLFTCIERLSRFKQEITHNNPSNKSKTGKDSCDKVYDVKYINTIRSLPRTLILDLPDIYHWDSMMFHHEFLDLSRQMESVCSNSAENCTYKLVVVEAAVEDGEHSIVYVRASKYLNQNVMDNMWYEINDNYVKLVPFTELFKPKEVSLMLIYEQMNS